MKTTQTALLWRRLSPLIFACMSFPACTAPSEDAFDARRRAMVEEQIAACGISDPATLDAMRTVPRHEFVPPDLCGAAYEDRPLPIGYGQTISQPYIVAFMTEAIRPRNGEKILEIGAGSGYQAAVLAHSGAEVFTVEIIAPLAALADGNLRRLGIANVQVRHGDGHHGWLEHAPFDAIVVTCAPDNIPPDLVAQLRDGGRMIIPVGDATSQQLVFLRKNDGHIEKQSVLSVRFVPMTGKDGRP